MRFRRWRAMAWRGGWGPRGSPWRWGQAHLFRGCLEPMVRGGGGGGWHIGLTCGPFGCCGFDQSVTKGQGLSLGVLAASARGRGCGCQSFLHSLPPAYSYLSAHVLHHSLIRPLAFPLPSISPLSNPTVAFRWLNRHRYGLGGEDIVWLAQIVGINVLIQIGSHSVDGW